MDPGHKDKLLISTGMRLDTIVNLRDFVILYMYTYYKMSSREILQNFEHVMVDARGKQLSRRTIHRIVTRHGVNRDFRVAQEIKRKRV